MLLYTIAYVSLLSISSSLGYIGFPFHIMLLHIHFVLAWFSLYPGGTVGISFSNTLFSYAKYNLLPIQFQVLSIASPISLCKVLYGRKLSVIVTYAMYVRCML